MSKLRLQLDDLTVDTFHTLSPEPDKGTVFGEQCSCDTVCSCPGCPTCDQTCPYTCDDDTCGGQGTCYGNTCEGTCFRDGCGHSQWETCWRICGPVYP
jgi:hypothetical protein